ncbi:MAG: hypothetical protein ABI639_08315 [Thermoanaerobaculia bacterium]
MQLNRRSSWILAGLIVASPLALRADGYRLDKTLPLAAGGTFSLRAAAGSIHVQGGDGTEAVVTITCDRADFSSIFNVRIESPRPDRVEVVIEQKARGVAGWFDGFHGKTKVEVTLPRSVSADLESSGGGIDASGLAGKVSAESSGGGVHVADLAGAAKLSSSGGGIEAEDVAGDIDAESSGGGVRIRAARGRVDASSSGGAVKVGFAAGNAKGGSLDSSGGGVTAELDPAVGLEIDASSSGGSVSCDLPITTRGRIGRDDLHGTLNGGGARLNLSSSGGGIRISAGKN